jgi:hypothetical protein
MERCATCPFFAKLESQCRVAGPQTIATPNPMNPGSLNLVGYWPPTREMNWCGQHPGNRDRRAIIDLAEEN